MGERVQLPKSFVLSLTFAAVVVILAGVKAAEPIISPFLIALFIAAISAPVMLWFMRHRVPRMAALALVMLLIVSLALVLSGLAGTSLDGFAQSLPQYQSRLQEINTQLLIWLASLGVHLDMDKARTLFDLSAAMGFVGSALNRLLGTLANAFLIFLTVAFILLELSSFRGKVHRIARDPEQAIIRFGQFAATLNRYIVIKSLLSLATGLTVAVILRLFSIDYAVLWGVVAFALNFVPNIGSIIAAVPALLMALIQHGFATAGWVALAYLVINGIVGNLIEPRLMGRSLGLSTLVVFVSLVVWGWLLGPVGMFLSVPLTMTLKIAFDSIEETRWLAVALGGEHEYDDRRGAAPAAGTPGGDAGASAPPPAAAPEEPAPEES